MGENDNNKITIGFVTDGDVLPDKRDNRQSRIPLKELDRMEQKSFQGQGISRGEYDDMSRMLDLGAGSTFEKITGGRGPEPSTGISTVKDDTGWPTYLGNGGGRKGHYCAKDHPPLPIAINGTTYHIYGGSATRDQPHPEMDVFIGLDYGMVRTRRWYPWEKGTEFSFPIKDMGVPESLKDFQSLLCYIEEQVLAGKKVFIGCIGGHGRTGLVLSALVKQMTGMDDSTTYVRENYCKKVVESGTQVDWLHKHFGITKVKATKGGGSWGTPPKQKKRPKVSPIREAVVPVPHKGNIHGPNNVK